MIRRPAWVPAVLAACLPRGPVLELAPYRRGTAWTAAGLLPRTDVTVITVEKDPAPRHGPRRVTGRGFVELRCADAPHGLGEAGSSNLDPPPMPRAANGQGLDRTIAALAPHGMLIVDDMTATPQGDAEQHASSRYARCR